jgi:hypothetical protein
MWHYSKKSKLGTGGMMENNLPFTGERIEEIKRKLAYCARVMGLFFIPSQDHCQHILFVLPVSSRPTKEEEKELRVQRVTDEDWPGEIDFTYLEKMEIHNHPNTGLMVDFTMFDKESDESVTALCRSFSGFSVLSKDNWGGLAYNGRYREETDMLENLTEEIRAKTDKDHSVWTKMGISPGLFNELMLRMHMGLMQDACIYLATSSPLDDNFRKCANEILDDIAIDSLFFQDNQFCSTTELLCWSGTLPPLTVSISVIKPELRSNDLSPETEMAVTILAMLQVIGGKSPIVTEKQFTRWTAVVSNIYIEELDITFKLTLQLGDDSRHRLVLVEE